MIVKIKNVINNNKSLLENIFGSYLIKGLALIISFLTMPVFISYFNNDDVLGTWFTLLSLLQWVMFFDFGLGNGLRNKIAPLLVTNDKENIKKYVSSSYFIIGAISIIIFIVGLPFIFVLNWNKIFGVSVNLINKKSIIISVVIAFTGIVVQFFLKLISSILYSMKKVALSNFISLLSSIIILLYAFFIRFDNLNKSLIYLSVVHVLSAIIPLLVATLVLFLSKLKDIRPNIKYINKNNINDVLRLGSKFFYIQIALLLITTTNEVIISRFFGPSYVVEYLVYYRLFYLSVTLFSLISNPIWSEVSELIVLKNNDKIKTIYKYINVAVILTLLFNILVLFGSEFIVSIWLRNSDIVMNKKISLIFVFYSTISIYVISVSIFSNAFNKLKPQYLFFSIGIVIKIALIIFLNMIYSHWSMVVLATFFSLVPYTIVETIEVNKYINIQLDNFES